MVEGMRADSLALPEQRAEERVGEVVGRSGTAVLDLGNAEGGVYKRY